MNLRRIIFVVIIIGLLAVLLVAASLTGRAGAVSTHYYDMQAEAFIQGQTALLLEPSPELLALPDPYDPIANGPYRFHDAVLYNGNYYLYWGPVPALLIAGIKLVTGARDIPDSYLVYGFAVGIILFLRMLLNDLKRALFPETREWTVLVGILVAGLGLPFLYTLARPAVYEAAIFASQCFMLAALWCVFRAVWLGQHIIALLAGAGICAALAIGSRIVVGPALGFTIVMVSWWLWREAGGTLRRYNWAGLAGISVPIILSGIGLGLYNYLRFGSWTEFGVRYQLSSLNVTKAYEHFSSINNVLPNLYNYFLRPLTHIDFFPFVIAKWGPHRYPWNITPLSDYANVEPVAGILVSAPFYLFALAPMFFVFRRSFDVRLGKARRGQSEREVFLNWTNILFSGVALLCLVPLIIVLGASMRYMLDFLPSTLLVAMLGFWQVLKQVQGQPRARAALVVAAGSAFIYTIAIGLLLGTTGYYDPITR